MSNRAYGQVPSRDRRGVALVVVLWTVALLATATALASSAARSSAAIAGNVRAQAIARTMAESGIVAASAMIDDSLRLYAMDRTRRENYLTSLEPAAMGAHPLMQDSLSDGVFAVTVVDVSARLDVNNAGAEGLRALFATVTTPDIARAMGERIDAIVRGDAQGEDERARTRDSLEASLLGRERGVHHRRPFESLDALRDVPGLDATVLAKVAESLTVDGDGRVNRRAASRAVLAAASGSLVDAPSRLLLIARGWQRGHALSRELEAVYDVTDDGLHLVRWRERDR